MTEPNAIQNEQKQWRAKKNKWISYFEQWKSEYKNER